MRHFAACSLLVPLVVLLAGADCDNTGTYGPPDGEDAGPGELPVTAADIGVPCEYVRGSSDNPDNTCPHPDTKCLIFTAFGEVTSGLGLSGWEDQFTVFGEERDRGLCTLIGSLSDTVPLNCPAGTAPKVFTPDVTACMPECDNAAQCGRADYTCDARYLDIESPTCVRRCGFDVPDCIRSGVVLPAGANQLLPVLAFQDLAGASQCDTETGVCEFVEQHGVAGPGEPCTRTEECEAGAACIQGPVLAALVVGADPDGPGFCAATCAPIVDASPGAQIPEPACSEGFVCQAVGNLNINFLPGPIVMDLATGAVDQRGGLCFHQCEIGVEAACDPFPGTSCGSLDEAAVAAVWNTIPQCLPDSIRQ